MPTTRNNTTAQTPPDRIEREEEYARRVNGYMDAAQYQSQTTTTSWGPQYTFSVEDRYRPVYTTLVQDCVIPEINIDTCDVEEDIVERVECSDGWIRGESTPPQAYERRGTKLMRCIDNIGLSEQDAIDILTGKLELKTNLRILMVKDYLKRIGVING